MCVFVCFPEGRSFVGASSSSSLYFFFLFNGIEGNNSGDYCVHMVVYISALILPMVCTIFFGSLFLYNITIASFDRNIIFFCCKGMRSYIDDEIKMIL